MKISNETDIYSEINKKKKLQLIKSAFFEKWV